MSHFNIKKACKYKQKNRKTNINFCTAKLDEAFEYGANVISPL